MAVLAMGFGAREIHCVLSENKVASPNSAAATTHYAAIGDLNTTSTECMEAKSANQASLFSPMSQQAAAVFARR